MTDRTSHPARRGPGLRIVLLGSLALFAVLFVLASARLLESGVGSADAERAQALETGDPNPVGAAAKAEAAEAAAEPVEPVVTSSS